ncbi:SusC/RagA family TonB-linked outer membrane protein [Pedobacter alpinus]|uniref:SusC/RagA family TonB-linked outer membrane protein n=1 Tax=Pedobacter alpinus TaxID=1590643 RepID=A0ABW5TW79_9SPHI
MEKNNKVYNTDCSAHLCQGRLLTKFLKITLSLLLIATFAFSQQDRIVRGTILDENKQPVIGASVTVKGLQIATQTDLDGKFAINVPDNRSILVNFIGMLQQEINVSGKNNITITMKDNLAQLGEVVVVGYGTQKKESLVGAISQTNSKVLERTGGVTNLGMALTGNLPGVVTVSSSGMPGGEDPQILIRAQTTWNESSPLILVDGVERPLGSIDISSVESISVLKDASATAVFGVKGANGVILVTTKTGTAGKAVIRGRVNTTVKTISKLPAKYDSYDALSLRNTVTEHELARDYSIWSNMTPQDILLKYRFPANDAEWDRYPNVDWQEELFRDYAMSYGANASISGGTKAVTYFASADYVREGDLLKTFENNRGYSSNYAYNRINVRSNLDFSLTKTTKLSTKIFGSNGVRQFPWNSPSNNDNSAWTAAYRSSPDAMRPIYSDGTYGYFEPANFDVPNSIALLANSGSEQNTATQLTTDFIINQQLDMITKGLSFRANYSYDNSFLEIDRGINDLFNGPQRKYIYPANGNVIYERLTNPGTQLDFYETVAWAGVAGSVDKEQTFRRQNYSGQLNYNRSFEKHDVGLTGVFLREEIARGSQFPAFREDWVFRTTYAFASKYLFEANGAYNGSEQFGPDKRFAFFPSVSAGWVISNENFMKDLSFISLLKLRGGFGRIGSDRVGARWLYRDVWAFGGNSAMGTQAQNSPYTFFRTNQLGNPNIGWENVEKTNIAVDFDLLKGFISGSLDVFRDLRTDIIINGNGRAIPSYFGQQAPNANLGSVEGKGFELDLRFNYQFENGIRAWANTNITRAVNNVLSRDDLELLPDYQKQAGWQLRQTRSYLDQGYLQSWDDIYGSTFRNQNDQFKLAGDYNIIDFNADGIIDGFDTAPYMYSDAPQNTYMASVGADWKGLSVFVQFYGVNNVTRNVTFPTFDTYSNSNTAYIEGSYWNRETGTGDVPLPHWGALPGGVEGTRYQYDGSYIRLKNAEVAYTLSGKAVNRIGVKACRVFLNGNNLLLWTKMPDDRESNFASGSSNGAYPSSRRYNIGIDLTF